MIPDGANHSAQSREEYTDHLAGDHGRHTDAENLSGDPFDAEVQDPEDQKDAEDGETVVLGGIYNQTDRTSLDRTPFFGDLPYIGFLFKKQRVEKNRTELLIFVTPKILKDELSI